jgi:hypothetical protein
VNDVCHPYYLDVILILNLDMSLVEGEIIITVIVVQEEDEEGRLLEEVWVVVELQHAFLLC